MKTRTASWDTAILQSHQLSVRADILYGGIVVRSGLAIADGEISQDRTAATMSSLDITFAEPTLLPTLSGGLLTPYGYELAIYRGLVYGSGAVEALPCGVFPIQRSHLNGRTLLTKISAMDRSQRIRDARFEDDWTVAAGTNVGTAIQAIITDAVPGTVFAFVSTTYTTPAASFDNQADRWGVCQQMARSAGFELYYDGFGRCVMRNEPTPITTPVSWIVTDGANGALKDVDVSLDREPAYNRVIAVSSNATQSVIYRAVATDNNPASATYYSGPFGKKPRFYSSPFIGSQAQCQSAADAILASALGIGRTLDVSALPNPALEPGDVVQINRSANNVITNELHVIDSIKLGLTAGGGMECQTRTRQAAA